MRIKRKLYKQRFDECLMSRFSEDSNGCGMFEAVWEMAKKDPEFAEKVVISLDPDEGYFEEEEFIWA